MQYHIGKWNELLSTNDTEKLWSELHRIVAKHKLARSDVKRHGLYGENKYDHFTDLTQELFTVLLSKDRFNYYINNEMSDVEIEMEISQLELTNILTHKLRSRYPESFRIARRISEILRKDSAFDQYTPDGYKVKLGDKYFGLVEWKQFNYIRESTSDEQIFQLIEHIPSHIRDNTIVGTTGDTEVIIRTPELTTLIRRILFTVDSIMTVRQIRSAVMSKLPIFDSHIVSISDFVNDEGEEYFEPADARLNPEQIYINKDFESKLDKLADKLLEDIDKSVNHKMDKYKLACRVLYYTFLDDQKLNQYEISKLLKVSDATVHNYRKQIESLLPDLGITNLSEALQFYQVLKKKLRKLLNILESYLVMGE